MPSVLALLSALSIAIPSFLLLCLRRLSFSFPFLPLPHGFPALALAESILFTVAILLLQVILCADQAGA